MNLVNHSWVIINGIFKPNIVTVQSCSVPSCPILSCSFSLEWQFRSCLVLTKQKRQVVRAIYQSIFLIWCLCFTLKRCWIKTIYWLFTKNVATTLCKMTLYKGLIGSTQHKRQRLTRLSLYWVSRFSYCNTECIVLHVVMLSIVTPFKWQSWLRLPSGGTYGGDIW